MQLSTPAGHGSQADTETPDSSFTTFPFCKIQSHLAFSKPQNEVMEDSHGSSVAPPQVSQPEHGMKNHSEGFLCGTPVYSHTGGSLFSVDSSIYSVYLKGYLNFFSSPKTIK